MVLDLLAIDTETTGVAWDDEAFMISIATPQKTYVFDKRELYDAEWFDIISDVTVDLGKADRIIMHNAKFDMQKLMRLGIPYRVFVDKFEDTQAMAHLIDEHQPTGLKYLASSYLGLSTDEDEVLKVWRRKNKMKKEDGYYPIPNEILAPYAAKDAEFTLQLYTDFTKRLHNDLLPLYEIEKRLTLSLLRIEAQGMQVDREYVTRKRKEYGDRIYKLKSRIGELAGKEFNPQSHQQVLAALQERGFVVSSTSKDALSQVDDELAGLIVELREANKIKSTYFDALDTEAKNGILHPNFRQHGTRTGRMSSGAAEA
jgi:DNA polymerase I-like protein with 3'-5' exonuclease and polymerase domains